MAKPIEVPQEFSDEHFKRLCTAEENRQNKAALKKKPTPKSADLPKANNDFSFNADNPDQEQVMAPVPQATGDASAEQQKAENRGDLKPDATEEDGQQKS